MVPSVVLMAIPDPFKALDGKYFQPDFEGLIVTAYY
jgi:hypothetical protein